MRDDMLNDELTKCPVCGTPRVSRYAAYCHVCGSPLPELAPDANTPVDPPAEAQGWEAPAAAAGAATAAESAAGGPGGVVYRPAAAQPVPPADPAQAPGVRVYERPETPPSVIRKRRLTLIIAAVGILVSLLLLAFGPLKSVLGMRGQAEWSPPGTQTPVNVIIPTLPPGVSAAQATARARYTPTTAPTWTAGVPEVTVTTGGGAAGGALATVVLPTLAPAPTATSAATAVPTVPPATATEVPPTAPAATATSSPVPPTPTLPAPSVTPAPALTPGTGGSSGAGIPGAIAGGRAIAFVSDRSGSPQIWIMDAAGANQIPVTRDGQNTGPAWSLDDRYLYYVGNRGGGASVYRLDVTTGREEQVLQDPSVISARPLANGQLATLRTESGRYALYVGDRRLFQLDRSFQFQFSPDGRRVVIDPNVDPRAISVVDVGSTKATEVAPARSWNAGWGQGDRLTYVSDRAGIAGVYVAGPNGEEPRVVSPAGKWSQAPAFSSDGSQIAFIGADGAAWNLYVAGASGQGANGGNARKVGGPANPAKSPVWQPGGGLIAFESNRAGNWDIYVTDANGNERALTNDPGNDVDPAWTW